IYKMYWMIAMKYSSKRKIKKITANLIIFAIGVLFAILFISNSSPLSDFELINETNSISSIFSSKLSSLYSGKYSVEVEGIEDDSIQITSFQTGERSYIDISNVILLITNNRDESIALSFDKIGIVYENGEQVGMHSGGGLLASNSFTNKYLDRLDNHYLGSFTILPHGKQVFNLPFEKIDKERNPKFVINFIENPDIDVQVVNDLIPLIKKTGNEKEFVIPLKDAPTAIFT
ncbi:MAG: hypothetical protein Q7J10_02680, partial [Methanosarcinaceae archaeon]|nr:hypothetical protein [Methanosarcinaceae archaeon]